jgi:hypothetical protein
MDGIGNPFVLSGTPAAHVVDRLPAEGMLTVPVAAKVSSPRRPPNDQ